MLKVHHMSCQSSLWHVFNLNQLNHSQITSQMISWRGSGVNIGHGSFSVENLQSAILYWRTG